jgi:hypothetical protein
MGGATILLRADASLTLTPFVPRARNIGYRVVLDTSEEKPTKKANQK